MAIPSPQQQKGPNANAPVVKQGQTVGSFGGDPGRNTVGVDGPTEKTK